MTGPQTVTANFVPAISGPPIPYLVSQIWAGGSAVAINNFGQVVLQSPTSPAIALLWTPSAANGSAGSLTDLGSLPGINGTPSVVANGINDYGQVVGTIASLPNGPGQAFLWQPNAPNATSGSMISFTGNGGLSGANTTPTAINSFGQIIGTAASPEEFLWTPLTANGTIGTIYSDPRLGYVAINDFGHLFRPLFFAEQINFRWTK